MNTIPKEDHILMDSDYII